MWVKPRRSKHPPLPLEIVEQVIRLTDPSTVGGRHSLVAWARVSRACWSVATECLYNHVVVSRKRLRALLNGYKRRTAVSPRAAFVLAAVCRFTMVGPFGNAIASLWDMALRMGCTLDKPMFPNVRQLTLRKAPWGIAGWGGHDGQIPTKCLPQSDECAIFDRPDLCAEDEADWNELLRIPVRGFANVYLHRRGADILGLLPPQGWDQLVFFAIVPFDERHLHEQYRLRMRQSGRTLAILFNTSITTPPRLQPQVVRNVETTDIIQLRWFTPDELDECPCCAVCGERMNASNSLGT